MKIIKTNHLISNDNFNFFHHANHFGMNHSKKLDSLGGILIRFKEHSEFEFTSYLKSTINNLLNEFNLYFILMEDSPKTKNKIRTHKKILYRKIEKLGKRNILEIESEVKPEKTLIASIIRLDKKNIDYFFNNVYGSKVVIGYASRKNKRTFKSRRELLKSLVVERMREESSIMVNYAAFSQALIKKNAFVFRVFVDGRDRQNLEIYLPNDKVEVLYSKIKKLNLEEIPINLN